MEEHGENSAARISSKKRLAQTQANVDEVVGIMRINVEKVLERDQKLSELDDRADVLQQCASDFDNQARRIKRKYWWKNLKMLLIIGGIGVIVLIIIIVWATKGSGSGSNGAPVTSTTTSAPTNG